MKTSEFIRECAIAYNHNPRPRNGRKTVSSVVWDGETVYSYGQHYPLLFKLTAPKPETDGRGFYWICNDRGHSVTTSKHIGIARQYSDFNVHLIGGRIDPQNIIDSATQEIARIDEYITASLTKIVERPRYAPTYQRNIDAYEMRRDQLVKLIATASAVNV